MARRTCGIETDCDSNQILAGADGSVASIETGSFTTKVKAPSSPAPMNFCLRSGTSSYFGECFSWDPHLYPVGGGQLPPNVCVPQQEVCNGKDDDCDGQMDETGNTYYVDRDRDGLGDPATSFGGCTQPPGYVTIANDTCDQGRVAYYLDADHDGEGDPNKSVVACAQPQDYVANDNDCCDLDARAKLGQTNWFSEANACGSYDYDCVNGASRRYDTTAHEDNCVGDRDTETCFGATALEANTTECGVEFMRRRCGWNASPKTTGFCVTSSSTVTQECH